MISLLPLAPAEAGRVAHLRMAPGQDAFTADPAVKLAGLSPEQDGYGIVLDGTIIGFLVIDRAHELAGPGELGLRSVLVDAGWQGKGLGVQAMRLLPALAAERHPEARAILLTVNLQNEKARATYLRAGFVDGGEMYLGGRSGPQHVLRLALD